MNARKLLRILVFILAALLFYRLSGPTGKTLYSNCELTQKTQTISAP